MKIDKFSSRGWLLKCYKPLGQNKFCPSRLVVNVYKGCSYNHKYCYISKASSRKECFRSHLVSRISKALMLGINKPIVIISSSTDPLQCLEEKYWDSLFAIEKLIQSGFRVLLMTRNPRLLLSKNYSSVVDNPNLFIDVSIPSSRENVLGSIFYSGLTPELSETYEAIDRLSRMGKKIRIKIEPVIPSFNGVIGQSKDDFEQIVKNGIDVGVRTFISKTLRLNHDIDGRFYRDMLPLYLSKGILEGSGNNKVYRLFDELRRNLLIPLKEVCDDYHVDFCSCIDSDAVNQSVSCEIDYSSQSV